MPHQRPFDPTAEELLDAYLARKGAVWLVEAVLSGDFKAGPEVLTREEKIEGWWCYDDFCEAVRCGLVEM